MKNTYLDQGIDPKDPTLFYCIGKYLIEIADRIRKKAGRGSSSPTHTKKKPVRYDFFIDKGLVRRT